MITDEEEKYILTRAYIPEHIVGLMTRVSGGEPFLFENCFCCLKDDWIIVVGYPLKNDFGLDKFEALIDKIIKRFRPKHASLIAPELPVLLETSCVERESDHYYTLDIHNSIIKSGLRRTIDKALKNLTVERSTKIREAHNELVLEFVERAKPSPRVKKLFFRMPEYVGHSKEAFVLNAWDKKDNLAAFYIVDLAAKNFSAYVIGCYSKNKYIPGASDLLFFEMIKISMEYGKSYIHLGLGVNEGISRFKKNGVEFPHAGTRCVNSP